MDQNSDDFYRRLKHELEKSTSWPSEYLFKFIVTTDRSKIDVIQDLFDGLGAVIKTQQSKNGKYTSLSINVRMQSADQVIKKYREVSVVKGVISL